ncbi:MAG: DUF4271 domain-containing protein [Flavobacteriales bacterium]|jgi:hypothetical protein|nr:DUF4271 domain-containing protein [Flavobacteriales bacterium]
MEHPSDIFSSLRPDNTLHWLSFVIFLSVAILAYSKQRNNSIQIALKSFFNIRFFKQSLREETNSSIYSGRVLLVNAFITISITLFYFLSDFSSFSGTTYFFFLFLFLLTLLWYIINTMIKYVISKISGLKVIENESIRYNQYFFQVLGIFLLPGIIGLYFFPHQLMGYNFQDIAEKYIIVATLLLLANKLIQSIFQSFEIKISWFYIFLYICTLEILPLCIGFQLIINQNPI